MKNLFLFVISALLISCSSDVPVWEAGTDVKSANVVNIKLKNVEDYSTELKSKPLSKSDIVSVFYQVVEQNNQVLRSRYLTTDEFTNGIQDTLPNGFFYVRLYGATKLPNKTNDAAGSEGWYIDGETVVFPRELTTDFFEAGEYITVDNEPITLELNMVRTVAKIEVIPTNLDRYPATVDYVSLFLGTPTDDVITPEYKSIGYFYKMKGTLGRYETELIQQKDFRTYEALYENPEGRAFTPLSSVIYDETNFKTLSASNPIVMYVPAPADFSKMALYARIAYKTKRADYRILKSNLDLKRNKILRITGDMFASEYDANGIKIDKEWDVVVDGHLD